MVQILKYTGYILAFFLTLHVLVWIKYSVNPEEKITKIDRKLSYEEAKSTLKGTVDYKINDFYESKNSVVKISTDWFLTYKYDTLSAETNYYTKSKE